MCMSASHTNSAVTRLTVEQYCCTVSAGSLGTGLSDCIMTASPFGFQPSNDCVDHICKSCMAAENLLLPAHKPGNCCSSIYKTILKELLFSGHLLKTFPFLGVLAFVAFGDVVLYKFTSFSDHTYTLVDAQHSLCRLPRSQWCIGGYTAYTNLRGFFDSVYSPQ